MLCLVRVTGEADEVALSAVESALSRCSTLCASLIYIG
jgi:hypothetical protein